MGLIQKLEDAASERSLGKSTVACYSFWARRLRFLAQGLTGEGLPRKRSANGTRKPYVRKKHTTASPYYRKRMEADSRLMGS